MNCNLIFKIGDLEISFLLESKSPTYPTNEEILNALKNPLNAKQKDELLSYIEDNYTPDKPIELDVDKILENPNGLVGNTTIFELARKFPTIPFPEGVNANVLAVASIKTGGHHISGRVINSNGEELFIINNKDDLFKLANFLKIRKILQENPNLFDPKSDNYADLEILRKKFNKNSISELIIDFIEDQKSLKTNNPIRNEYFKNSEGNMLSVYTFLDSIARHVLQYNLLKQYNSPFINAINSLHIERQEKTTKLKAIKHEELYYAIQAFYPELLKKLNIENVNQFKKKIFDTNFDESLFDIIIKQNEQNKPLIYTLFANLIKDEKKYQYEIKYVQKDEILLSYKFETLKSLFGFGYDTIRTFDLIDKDYKGYKIYSFNYNGLKVYIYNRNYITENTTIYKTFDSVEELTSFLDNKILTEKLKTNSFLKFKFRSIINGAQDPSKYIYKIENYPGRLEIGTIIESLEIPIDPLTNLKSDEKKLLDSASATLLDFYNLIDKWDIDDSTKEYIKNNINNSEKAVAYIYLINKLLKHERTNEEQLKKIADNVFNAPKVAYYINSLINNGYSLIPTEPNVVEKWKDDKSYPVVLLFQAMQLTLKKIGVSLNMLTSEEISNKFPNMDANSVKAFIYNGEIYVNTTIASGEDLLHEYTHIFLGILKSNPKLREQYENLINIVWDKVTDKERKQVLRDYSDISEMDAREELFARKFSEYLMSKRNNNLDSIFLQSEEYIKKGIKSIFDLSSDEDLQTLSNRNIDNVFLKFSTDIALLLEKNSDSLNLDEIKETRKKISFINKLIKDGKITEIC